MNVIIQVMHQCLLIILTKYYIEDKLDGTKHSAHASGNTVNIPHTNISKLGNELHYLPQSAN